MAEEEKKLGYFITTVKCIHTIFVNRLDIAKDIHFDKWLASILHILIILIFCLNSEKITTLVTGNRVCQIINLQFIKRLMKGWASISN